MCTLKRLAEQEWGIHCSKITLTHEGKMISDDQNASSFLDDSNVYMSIKDCLSGGAKDCEICGEMAEYNCEECKQDFCGDCCSRVHQHKKRIDHKPCKLLPDTEDSDYASLSEKSTLCNASQMSSHSSTDIYENVDEEDCFGNEEVFTHAMMIATLAEHFNLTEFKPFQKEVIDNLLCRNDCLVIQPTGSGKSLCFQFTAIYENKLSLVIAPTISLMQDQVMNAKKHGTKAVYLGSAQMDKSVEEQSLQKNADINLIFVTPEWISKVENKQKIVELVEHNRLALVAFDEVHLYHYWQEFRPAYKELKNLKDCFLDVPFLALTATATPAVQNSILQLLRNPFITTGSINRPNIHLACEEISSDDDFRIFASRAVEIIGGNCAVVYVDFINNIGPIVNQLHSLGTDTVAYHGEMDIKSRDISYTKWKTGEIKIMVATTAFGMGIDKEDIRHVVRYGVPENLCSWTQELGRAGRDGKAATATIIYSSSNIDHASAWIKQHHHNQDYCTRVLKDFEESWKYVIAHISCTCRRKVLLDMFGEESCFTECSDGMTCDVCEMNASNSGEELLEVTTELKTLVNAIDVLGVKGELKISQWIRGSNAAWTQEYNKLALSYGNFKGHSEAWWRLFIKMLFLGFRAQRIKIID